MKAVYFESASEFRKWLEKNHGRVKELLVGFHKKHSGKKSIAYPEALDEALCFGWIDGVRKSVDENRYTIRFTPRRPLSIWSVVNIKRVQELKSLGRMEEPGLAVFDQRDEAKSRRYSFEQKNPELDPAHERKFRANKRAWAFFQLQPPWYQRTCKWFVMSAQKEETRERRLATLIEASQKGVWLPGFPQSKGRGKAR